MTPREIIAQANKAAWDNYPEPIDAHNVDEVRLHASDAILSALQSHGHRIVGAGLDAETIEACENEALAVAKACSKRSASAQIAGDHPSVYRHNTAFHAAYDIAAAIRALGEKP